MTLRTILGKRLRPVTVLAVTVATLAAIVVLGPTATAAGSGPIKAVGSGRCLDVTGSNTAPGTLTEIWDCSGAANQTWTYSGSHQLTVYSGSSQLCLDAYGKGTSPGTAVDVWTCNGQTNQQWNVNANGTITGVQSGLCLDVTGAGIANGTRVELWTCNGGSNQQWNLGSPGTGGSLPSSFT